MPSDTRLHAIDCSGSVLPTGGVRLWGHGRCYGFCQAGLGRTRFLVVVGCLCEVAWERPSCFLVASERCRGERAGFQGAQSPWASGGWCFCGAFPLLSSGRGFLYSHGQTAIRKRQGKSLRLHYDVFGSRRGTSTLNLQSGLFWCSATVARVRRSKAFLKS